MTSPPLIEPSWIQVGPLIEFLMKWTEPSPKRQSTPPGWRDRVARVRARIVCLVVAAQHLGGLAVAEGAGIGGAGARPRRTTDRADVVVVVEGQGPADARQGPGVGEGQPDGQKVLVSVGGEPRHIGTSTCVAVPDRPAEVVGRSLQQLRSDVRIAGPIRERGRSDRDGAQAGRVDAKRRLQKQVAGQDRTENALAKIQVSPIDAVIPLRRHPRIGGDEPAGGLAQGRKAEGLDVIAGALEGGDPRRHDRAVDDIAE